MRPARGAGPGRRAARRPAPGAAPVLADPSRGAPADWVLLAVKTHQTAAPDWLRRSRPGTVVAVLQNGVEHRALVGPFAGPRTCCGDRLVPVRGVSPALVRQPGRQLTVPDGRRRTARALLDAQVDLAPDFRTEAWRKLCLNAVAAVMVLAGRRAEVYGDPSRSRSPARSPTSASPSAAPRAPSSTRAPPTRSSPRSPRCRRTWAPRCCSTGSPERRLEWDARNGVVARLGARHGIPTPVSADVSARLEALDGAGWTPPAPP